MKAPMCSADNCNVLIDLAPLCEVCVSILSWCIIFFSHSVSVWLNVAYGQNCLHTLTDDFELLEMQKIWQGFIPSTVEAVSSFIGSFIHRAVLKSPLWQGFIPSVEAVSGFMGGFIHQAVLKSPLWQAFRWSRFWSPAEEALTLADETPSCQCLDLCKTAEAGGGKSPPK